MSVTPCKSVKSFVSVQSSMTYIVPAGFAFCASFIVAYNVLPTSAVYVPIGLMIALYSVLSTTVTFTLEEAVNSPVATFCQPYTLYPSFAVAESVISEPITTD